MTWEKKRVLVTGKAYPEDSRRHGTVVCTGGITGEGDWIRLYPMPMWCFSGQNKIKKYDWIEVECKKADDEKLRRKESYKVNADSIKIIDRTLSSESGRAVNWKARNAIILKKLDASIETLAEKFKEDRTSMGLIKPKDILDFYKEGELNAPTGAKKSAIQKSLTGGATPIIDDIAHMFKYKFRCSGCQKDAEHNIQCEDWELMEAYRDWSKRYKDANILWEKLREKYYDYLKNERDVYFYMGTYSQFPTWLIIGLYYPPKGV